MACTTTVEVFSLLCFRIDMGIGCYVDPASIQLTVS